MDVKKRINDLCAEVIKARDGSEELRIALAELQTALGDHTRELRKQVADVRDKVYPVPDDL
jgi:hypothetical protein